MKKHILLSSFLLLLSLPLAAEVKVAPYYSLSFDEGAVIPNKGEWMYSINLTNDMGIIVEPAKQHRLIGFYELKYSGPGLQRQEGGKSKDILTDHTLTMVDPEVTRFTDRTIDHVGIFKYHYIINEMFTLKTQLDMMKEYKRTGANEAWGEGLYDFTRNGYGVALNAKLLPKLSVEANIASQSFDFPNYTGLLEEVQMSSGSADTSTGVQNHKLVKTGFTVKYGHTDLSVDYTAMAYDKQKVVTETRQADGTFYSATLQKDTVLTLSAGHEVMLFGFIYIAPSFAVKTKASNQNYQHFTNATSTVPVSYFGDYYSYEQTTLSIPFSLLLTKKWEMFCNTEFTVKTYASRPPQNDQGDFMAGVLKNDLKILSTGFSFRPNPVTTTTLFYTYQSQTSNMKFEKYTPYNYDGYTVGVGLKYTY